MIEMEGYGGREGTGLGVGSTLAWKEGLGKYRGREGGTGAARWPGRWDWGSTLAWKVGRGKYGGPEGGTRAARWGMDSTVAGKAGERIVV